MMRYKLILILFILCSAEMASAQNLSVFNIDATNFPTMKAKFYAFDANDMQQSPSASEITVTEDGIARTVISVTCPPKKNPPPITLGIMVDTYSRIDLAQEGAKKLISLFSIPPSEAGITLMDHGAFIVQDLTQKHAKLDSAIKKLGYAPGVNLQEMFYTPNAGGVPFVSGGPNKKVLVLISDLHCPQYNLNQAQLISDCSKNNISVYVILVNSNDAKGYFKPITEQTGGKLFENIYSTSDLDKVLLLVAAQEGVFTPCELTWKSEASCRDSLTRNGLGVWNGAKASFSYTLTAGDIFRITPQFVLFVAKPIGKKFDTTITFTSGSSFTITNITSSDPSFDVNPKSFSLAQGEIKTITISYTPADSGYTWSEFTITTDQCSKNFYASGGYPGIKPKKTLLLTQPNGGEVYLAGSDTVITWKGIPLSDNVNLNLSTDAGKSWSTLTTTASNGIFKWHIPNVVSNQCLVSVNQDAPPQFSSWPVVLTKSPSSGGWSLKGGYDGNIYITGGFGNHIQLDATHSFTSKDSSDVLIAKYHPDASVEWAIKAGGTGICNGNAIETDLSGNIYVAGIFSGKADFGGQSLTSYGGHDIFLAKYAPDGSLIWATQAGSIYDDVPSFQIAVDPAGNIYMSGNYQGAAKFDTAKLPDLGSSVFLAKYKSDGKLDWIKNWYDGFSSYENGGYSVRLGPSGNIYLLTVFIYTVTVQGKTFQSGSNNPNILILKFRPDGSLVWGKQVGQGGQDVAQGMAVDSSEHIYITGHFDAVSDFGGVMLQPSANVFDQAIFTAKYDSSGALQWARSGVGSRNNKSSYGYYNTGVSIASDPTGNVAISGYVESDSLYFDNLGIRASSGGAFDILVAAYNSDGVIQWAKCAGGNSDDRGLGIAEDIQGNIYSTGWITSPAHIDNKTIAQTDSAGLFIWKFGNNTFQSDTSDALFSIIMPTFSFGSKTIDMGQVETGTEKDSVVKATICNSGNVPLHVLGMDVTGGDKTEFMIMAGAGDFTLQPGECRDVMFSFMPMMPGNMSATVTLHTSAGDFPDTIKIIGVGIPPLLAVNGNIIDFGQVRVGLFKDTVISVAIKNLGNTTINFSPANQLGPDTKQFSLQSANSPFSLTPGASQTVTLRFYPRYIGRTSGRIAFNYNGPSSPAILNVFGQGLGGLIHISDDSGYAEDHRHIPINLEKVPVTAVQSVTTNFSTRIAFDNSLLTADSGIVQPGNSFDTVTMKGSLGTSNTISFLSVKPYLGKITTSPLNIVDFTWLDGSGNPVDYDVETKSGTFTVLNGCGDSLLRNFMVTGKMPSITSISPNPSNTITHIEIQTTEKGRTQLAVMNLLGLQVARLFDGELQSGAHSFDFDTSKLPSGSYFLMLTTPTAQKMERIDVVK